MSQKDYRPQHPRRLARSMGVEEEGYSEFRTAVKALMKAGRVILGGSNCLTLPLGRRRDRGHLPRQRPRLRLRRPRQPDRSRRSVHPPQRHRGAISGDTVEARITRRGSAATRPSSRRGHPHHRTRPEPIRRRTRPSGRAVAHDPDGHALHAPVVVGDVRSTRPRGRSVVVELTDFPSATRAARGWSSRSSAGGQTRASTR